MTEKLRPEPALQEKAAEAFDHIRARLREIEAEKQRERERPDPSVFITPSTEDDGMYAVGLADIEATARHLRECWWRQMSEESNAWQAEWLRRHREAYLD